MRSVVCVILASMLTVISASAVFGANFQISTAFELHAALKQAAINGEDDVVTLEVGTYSGNFTFAPEDTQSLTLQGAKGTNPEDVILDGADTNSVLTLWASQTKGSVVVSGLTMQNGNVSNGQGGGIRVAFANASLKLTLRHVIVQNNVASDMGGGIELDTFENAHLSVKIWDSILRYNKAQRRGGGIDAYAWKGNSSIDILIVNSLIYGNGNQANWTDGGINLAASEVGENNIVHATIVNTTITGNLSNLKGKGNSPGGGIHIYGYRGNGVQISLDLYNSIVWGNTAIGGASGQDLYVGEYKPGVAEVYVHRCDLGDVFVDDSGGTPIYEAEDIISARPLFVNPEAGTFTSLLARRASTLVVCPFRSNFPRWTWAETCAYADRPLILAHTSIVASEKSQQEEPMSIFPV